MYSNKNENENDDDDDDFYISIYFFLANKIK